MSSETDSLGDRPGLGDKGEKVSNVNDESFALGPWVYCDGFKNRGSKKGFQTCGNNELVISLRFYGTPEWICLVCKVEFRREIGRGREKGCPRGG